MFGISLETLKKWGWSFLLYILKQLGYWYGLVMAFGTALVLYLTNGFDILMNYVFDTILPSQSPWDWSQLKGFFEYANEWMPIKEIFIAVAAIWAGKASMIVVKLFVKLFIPTVG